MRPRRKTVLALAVRASRVGYVYLVDGKATDWHLSEQASKSPAMTKRRMSEWLRQFKPDVVVLEDHRTATRKSGKNRAIIKALLRTAQKHNTKVVELRREQHYPNRYDEARELAELFPELAAWRPDKPEPWVREPRNLVYFECLALALQSDLVPGEL